MRAEEIFRQEIRNEIEAVSTPGSRRGQMWRVLNTPFVLWILSSVLLGSLGWSLAALQASRDIKSQRAEALRKLDGEIGNRIEEALNAITALEADIKGGSVFYSKPFIYDVAVEALDNRQNKRNHDTGIYPEFRQHTFPSLVAELRRLVPPAEVELLDKSVGAYRTMRAGAGGVVSTNIVSSVGKHSQGDIDVMLKDTSEVSDLIRKDVRLKRW